MAAVITDECTIWEQTPVHPGEVLEQCVSISREAYRGQQRCLSAIIDYDLTLYSVVGGYSTVACRWMVRWMFYRQTTSNQFNYLHSLLYTGPPHSWPKDDMVAGLPNVRPTVIVVVLTISFQQIPLSVN